MSEVITITFDEEGKRLLAKLAAFPVEMRQAIARGMDKGLGLMLGQITRTRFTGQGPFPVGEHRLGVGKSRPGHQGNRLRNSLRWNATGLPGNTSGGQPSQIAGDTISGQIGTNVEYMGSHEFGFSGSVTVRSFTRKVSPTQFTKAGTGVKLSKIKGKEAKQAALGTERVRSFSRQMNIPERAPLRTGIGENMPTLVQEITTALRAAWEKKGNS